MTPIDSLRKRSSRIVIHAYLWLIFTTISSLNREIKHYCDPFIAGYLIDKLRAGTKKSPLIVKSAGTNNRGTTHVVKKNLHHFKFVNDHLTVFPFTKPMHSLRKRSSRTVIHTLSLADSHRHQLSLTGR